MTAPINPDWQQRVDTINSLLPRINRDDTRERLLRERRTLLRRIHGIPLYLQLPLDWQP
jgi:hypothetical protein